MKWQAQTAKAKFSALLRAAREKGPQTITVHGKEAVVMVSKAEFDRLKTAEAPARTGLDLFKSIRELDIDLDELIGPRTPDPPSAREAVDFSSPDWDPMDKP
jgi:prevent-host-death family protein